MISDFDDAKWRSREDRNAAYAGRRAQRAVFGHGTRVGQCGLRMVGDLDVGWIPPSNAKTLANWPGVGCNWAGCCVCGRSIRARKAAELVVAASRWEKGHRWDMASSSIVAAPAGWLMLLTIAPPHHPGDDLKKTLGRLDTVWRVIMSDRAGKEWRERWDIRHHFAVLEATVGGVRGDHPHRHVLLFGEGPPPDPADVGGSLLGRLWNRAIKLGGEHLDVMDGWTDAGMDCREAGSAAADYIAKVMGGEQAEAEKRALGGVGAEMTDAQGAKAGRGDAGGVSTLAVCRVIAEAHRRAGGRRIRRGWINSTAETAQIAQALRTWRDLTFGRPMLSASRGLRADLIPDMEDLSDEDLLKKAQELRDTDRAAVDAALGKEPEMENEQEGAAHGDYRPLTLSTDMADMWWEEMESREPAVWGGPEAEICRLVERVGAGDAADVIARMWAKTGDPRRAQILHHTSGRVRVGLEGDDVGDCWVAAP